LYIHGPAMSLSYVSGANIRKGEHTKTFVSSGSDASVLFNAVCISAAVPSKNLPHPRGQTC
jgi:hypothetical protein